MTRSRQDGRKKAGGVPSSAPPVWPTTTDNSLGTPIDTVMLKKTKLCRFFAAGKCARRTLCTFAHGCEEIKDKPNFWRTQMCFSFVKTGVCKYGQDCRYAHRAEDLRPPTEEASSASGSSTSAAIGSASIADASSDDGYDLGRLMARSKRTPRKATGPSSPTTSSDSTENSLLPQWIPLSEMLFQDTATPLAPLDQRKLQQKPPLQPWQSAARLACSWDQHGNGVPPLTCSAEETTPPEALPTPGVDLVRGPLVVTGSFEQQTRAPSPEFGYTVNGHYERFLCSILTRRHSENVFLRDLANCIQTVGPCGAHLDMATSQNVPGVGTYAVSL